MTAIRGALYFMFLAPPPPPPPRDNPGSDAENHVRTFAAYNTQLYVLYILLNTCNQSYIMTLL